MASNKRDIIEIGEEWACALRTADGVPSVHCFYDRKLVTELPISSIIQCVPFNHTISKEPKTAANDPFSITQVPEPKSLKKVSSLLNTHIRRTSQSANAFVVTAGTSASSLVIAVGGNSRHNFENEEVLNTIATTEAAQNMASTGASPVAFFKLPTLPDQNTQPILGLVGLLPHTTPRVDIAFKAKGDMIYLLGRSVEDIASSEYLYVVHHIHPSPAPWVHPQEQSRLQTALSEALNKNLVSSIHSITRGGVFTSLIESSRPHQLGFDITTDVEIREDAFLFGESLGRFVVSTSEASDAAFVDLMTQRKIPVTTLGHTTKGEIRVDDISYGFIRDFE